MNGEVTNNIKPSRGLWHGDPMSPYIFILCLEQFGHWIQNRVEEGRWKALKASRSGPKLSHIFFADDILLFAEASDDQASCIKEGLGEVLPRFRSESEFS